jgi:uncharacterized protein YbjT (DUF2867 family)
MRVVIAGGHGKIAMRLGRLLIGRGDSVVGLIRNQEHAGELTSAGMSAVVIDLEQSSADELAEHLAEADAVVFAAGAGPGSGAARKDTVDRGASVLLAAAAERAGVRRFLQVSAMNLDRAYSEGMDDVFSAYLRAKEAAERDLKDRGGLEWTIVRPGKLTDDPATGKVLLSDSVERAEITRDDIALVLLALLDEPRTAGRTLEVVGGDRDVTESVAAIL